MSTFARAPLTLLPRRDDEAPLAIAGVFARGAEMGERLVDALLALDDATLRRLRGVRSTAASVIVVIGPEELLPWRDGVRYLGVAAPGLYVPTTRTPSLPASLAAEALARHLPAAWIDDVTLVPLRSGLPLSQAAIVRGMQAVHSPTSGARS